RPAESRRELHRARKTKRKRSARLRMGRRRCARQQESAWPAANSAAVPQAFSQPRTSASFALRQVGTVLTLAGFHEAQAARPALAVPRAGQRPLPRTTETRDDGRGFSAAPEWRQ